MQDFAQRPLWARCVTMHSGMIYVRGGLEAERARPIAASRQGDGQGQLWECPLGGWRQAAPRFGGNVLNAELLRLGWFWAYRALQRWLCDLGSIAGSANLGRMTLSAFALPNYEHDATRQA
jgi:hypothetical protein